MAEELPLALYDHMRKPGDAPLNPRGVQGSKVLRATYREFKHELEHLSRDDCDVHAHPTPISRRECLGRQLWSLALKGERWAVHTLLLRWIGRPSFDIDVSQRVSIDLTKTFDERALARYRWLVLHEDTLTADEQLELHRYRMRGAVPDLPSPGGTDDGL